MENRVFTPEELKQIGKAPSAIALEMAQSGDPEKAVEAIKLMENLFTGIHDLYGDWVAALLSYIHRHLGAEAAEEAMTPLVKGYMDGILENFDDLSFHDKVVNCIMGLTFSHNEEVVAEEDDEKVTYHMKFCRAGQRQVSNGLYDGENSLCSRVDACSSTWGMDNFPVYCIHAPIQDKLAIAKIGHPHVVYTPCSDMCREACRISVYKDNAKIPEEAFTRVGMTKPAK